MSTPRELPPFPVDEATLDMLMAAIDPRSAGDTEAESSCVETFLSFMSELAGSDPSAVLDEVDADIQIRIMRDPIYSPHDVMIAMVNEIRNLRQVIDLGL